MQKHFYFALFACFVCMVFACKKDRQTSPAVTPPVNGGLAGIYSDSIFYVQSTNNTVKPLLAGAGNYSSLPDGLDLDENTGEINVNSSETGLKYKVVFAPAGGGDVQTSTVIISGINYQDKIYNLAKGDSIAIPIYNANAKLTLPGANASTIFDQNGGCKKVGINVNTGNGNINLASSVRNQGIDTGATAQVKLTYRLNDGSNNSLNGLDVKVYFYRTVSEIPQYLTDLLAARKTQILGVTGPQITAQAASFTLSAFAVNAKKPVKARPPCIIVVSR